MWDLGYNSLGRTNKRLAVLLGVLGDLEGDLRDTHAAYQPSKANESASETVVPSMIASSIGFE